MQLRAALQLALRTLVEHDVPSPQLAAELLLMHVLGCDRGSLYANPQVEVSAETAARYFALIGERATGKPTQYITGHQEFWGLDFEVTPEVMIPRPETEHLVEAVIDLAAREGAGRDTALSIIDVGTGSGCIALALASEFPQADILAVDISPAALAIASRNAARLKLDGRVTFLESDLLGRFLNEGSRRPFDFVVSNPPYVGADEIRAVQREVREFEPRLAWGGLEPADEVYRRLLPQALQVLRPGGYVAVEVGYNMAERVRALMGEGWAEVEARPDLAGIPRVVTGRKMPLACGR